MKTFILVSKQKAANTATMKFIAIMTSDRIDLVRSLHGLWPQRLPHVYGKNVNTVFKFSAYGKANI